ncbi:MAG: hypothetical protein WCR95_06650 [Eubacteriales bacterium]
MSTENVKNKIFEKSRGEILRIQNDAAEKAEQVRQSILDEAESRAKDIIDRANAKAELTVSGAFQKARLSKRVETLNHTHVLIESVREEVRKMLTSLPGGAWEELYTRLVAENSPTGEVVVSAGSKEVESRDWAKLLVKWGDLITKQTGVKTSFTLDKTPPGFDFGVMLRGESFDIDLSPGSLAAEYLDGKEKEIAGLLLGE